MQVRRQLAQIPPFLWIWAVLFLAGIPGWINDALFRLETNQGGLLSIGPQGGVDRAVSWAWAYLPFLLWMAPFVVLSAGLALVLVPAFTERAILRRTRLKPLGVPQGAAMVEIISFVRRHAPTVEMTANLARTTDLAIVYPTGYGSSAIGLFGGMVKAWRNEPAVARAILLHELAHHRQGDALFVNAGSPLVQAVRTLPALILVSVILNGVWIIRNTLQLYGGWSGIGVRAANLGLEQTEFLLQVVGPGLIQTAPSLFLMALAPMLHMLSVLIPLIAALWCVEFNADRFALAAEDDRADFLRWLNATPKPRNPYRYVMQRLSHPPKRLRVWLARNAESWPANIVLLSFFPLAIFVDGLLEVGRKGIINYGMGLTFESIISSSSRWLADELAERGPELVITGLLILGWMIIVGRKAAFPVGIPTVRRPAFAAVGAGVLSLAWIGAVASGAVSIETKAPTLATDKLQYHPAEPVLIRYIGASGRPTDWITVIRAGSPSNDWGDWQMLDGARGGTVQKVAGNPGEYEVRLFFDWPNGGFEVKALYRFQVSER
jgi:Zn-dependent protease with chaperone function